MTIGANRSSKRQSFKRWAFTGAAVSVLTIFGAASAAQDADAYEFDIDARDLGAALTAFGITTGRQVLFNDADIAGRPANRIEGSYTADQAIEALLGGAGVDYRVDANGTLLVGRSYSQSAAVSRAGGAPAIVEAGIGKPVAIGPDGDGEAVVVSGRVIDLTTGVNLKGALVVLEPAGETASTDDLGRYRFSSIAPGSYTIRVSYLGYASRQQIIRIRSGEPLTQDFSLGGVAGVDTVVVYGQRSARAQSLNQERTAENSSTVLAADFLGAFNGTTISDSLRRAPGVAFEQNANTGDGSNVIIRGLEPDLNQVTLNGLRLPEGSGAGRSADLSNILTESIESVTINKTLLPSQDSNGVGGLVEIETKSPLDRARRFASFGLEYGERGNDQGNDFLASGTVSGVFGADDSFGVSLSAQYREREVTNISYSTNFFFAGGSTGNYLPLDENGEPVRSPAFLDPRLLYPFDDAQEPIVYPGGSTVGLTSTEDKNLSVTGSVQKTFGAHTDLRVDLTYSEVETATFAANTRVLLRSGRFLAPVPELNGEVRSVPTVEDVSPFLPPGINLSVSRRPIYQERESETTTLSFRGETQWDEWSLDYSAGFALGESAMPVSISLVAAGNPFERQTIPRSFLQADILDNEFAGRLVSVYDPLRQDDDSFVLPALTPEGVAFFNEAESIVFDRMIVAPPSTFSNGNNERLTGRASARREFAANYLDYLEAGVFFERADFENNPTVNQVRYQGNVVPIGDLGLTLAPGILSQVGAEFDFGSISQASLVALAAQAESFVDDGVLTRSVFERRPEELRTQVREEDIAAYLQGRVDIGKLEVIGGVRVARVDIAGTFFASPVLINEFGFADFTYAQRFGQVVSESASQTDWLPRVVANYRFTDRMALRAGYYNTVSRPRVENLSASASYFLDVRELYGVNGDQPKLSVRRGNPDLEPAITHNFDLSWEWFNDGLGVIKVSGFFKSTENALESARNEGDLSVLPDELVLPDTPDFNALPDNIFLSLIQPVNSEDTADIWGAELALERQFTFLPGVWSGFGFYGNYTYTDSARDQEFDTTSGSGEFITIRDVPFSGAPKHSGTAALTYSGYGFDANLQYTSQARRLTSYNAYGLHDYAEAVETLDFRVEYFTELAGADMRLFLRGDDLLRGAREASQQDTIGGFESVPRYYTAGRYFGGRSFSVGFSTRF